MLAEELEKKINEDIAGWEVVLDSLKKNVIPTGWEESLAYFKLIQLNETEALIDQYLVDNAMKRLQNLSSKPAALPNPIGMCTFRN